jgi:hypothetical protein
MLLYFCGYMFAASPIIEKFVMTASIVFFIFSELLIAQTLGVFFYLTNGLRHIIKIKA